MEPQDANINDENMILSTDFYQLTMIAAYYQFNFENDIKDEDDMCVFELFTRKLPNKRNFLIFAGLEQVLYYLKNARFTERSIEYLKGREVFRNIDASFFNDYLPNFRFDVDVWAMKEGTIFFPNEPVIRVVGPSIQAQLAETYLLSVINYQTIVASKAIRIRNVSQDKIVLEFGTRRAHSPQSGIYAARASYIGGFNGSSNVAADLELGITASGTMAHSFVQKFGEMKSFEVYYKYYKDDTILLIDTYDIKEGTLKATKFGNKINGIRVDSGDLKREAKRVRKILDNNGCKDVIIVLSSDLNEYKIKDILDKGAPVDAFGVGTEVVTSPDDPSLGVVYKLMEYNGEPQIKTSENKVTYPGRKQVYRLYDEKGVFKQDILKLEAEEPPEDSEPLLIKVLDKGELIYDLPSLKEIQKYCLDGVEKLPAKFKKLDEIKETKIKISEKLDALTKRLMKKYS
ncbi:MAG: nicotinate phosphoribosyltransferase [Candidatus Lokiarchaeota archaeon]|nr:nicotinate phosphoribosyltransferase [Candidatus Lokiarchaeota archaeon]